MNLCSILRAIAFGALLALCPSAKAADRSLAQIKAAAEAGNPEAQYEFARSFRVGGPEWRKWILAAATQGMGAAQDALAWEGIWGKFLLEEPLPRTRTRILQTHAARMQESLVWAAHGADRGFDHSRLILGFAYFRGTFVRRNETEAYRWLSLVREVAAVEAVYLNQAKRTLVQSMSPAQIREAELRATQHEPGGTIRAILRETVATNTRLSALSPNSNRSLAMLNEISVAAGSEVELTLNGLPVTVRCLRIGTDSVDLAVPPDTTPITFRIGAASGEYTPPKLRSAPVGPSPGDPAAAASKPPSAQSQAKPVAQPPSFAPTVEPVQARTTGVEPFIWLVGTIFVIVFAKGMHSLAQEKAKARAAKAPPARVKMPRAPEPQDDRPWHDYDEDEPLVADASIISPATFHDVPPERALEAPKWSLVLLRELEWKRFEELTAAYFREKGFSAKTTRIGADGGVDVELYQAGRPKPEALVQCKAWNSYTVGVKPVRELFGVMAAASVIRGIFVTTSTFTGEARDFAEGKRLELIDGETFLERIKALHPEAQARLLACATDGDYTTPSCPKCGDKMIIRTATKGRGAGEQFWGCRRFPRCRHQFPIRRAEAAWR